MDYEDGWRTFNIKKERKAEKKSEAEILLRTDQSKGRSPPVDFLGQQKNTRDEP